jgi:hypothetical protein
MRIRIQNALQAIALAHGLPDTYSTAGLDATLDGIV